MVRLLGVELHPTLLLQQCMIMFFAVISRLVDKDLQASHGLQKPLHPARVLWFVLAYCSACRLVISATYALRHTRAARVGAGAALVTLDVSRPRDHSSPKNAATVSILGYIGQSFSNAEEFLRGLARSNTFYSGSRAAGFFFRAACNPYSDHDFYVPPNIHCIGAAISFLSSCGVRWDSPYKKLEDIAACAPNSVVELHEKEFQIMYKHATSTRQLAPEPEHIFRAIRNALLEDHSRQTIPLDHGVVVRILRGRRDHDYYTGFNILTGRTTHRGTSQKVQLIWANGKSPMEQIFNFYGSQVQACITGFGAFHLYHDLSAKGEAWYWTRNTQHKEAAEAATLKYALRGYKFTIATSPDSVLRRLTNPVDGAKYLRFNLRLDIPLPLEEQRRATLDNLVWREANSQTSWLRSIPTEFRELLEKLHRDRLTMRAAGVRDDATYKDLAVRHCASFGGRGCGNRTRLPNEISGF